MGLMVTNRTRLIFVLLHLSYCCYRLASSGPSKLANASNDYMHGIHRTHKAWLNMLTNFLFRNFKEPSILWIPCWNVLNDAVDSICSVCHEACNRTPKSDNLEQSYCHSYSRTALKRNPMNWTKNTPHSTYVAI
jgi:hypothetical protein